jgi:hypothetical protein
VNQKLGMDTIAARGKREALQLQVVELLSITRDLGATHRAASSPSSFGIEPGEKTIAPWSIPSVNAAKVELESARSGALELINRLIGETNAQDLASANDVFKAAKWTRNWATIPRNLLQAPAVFHSIIKDPKNAVSLARDGLFSRAAYDAGNKYLTDTYTKPSMNPWLRKPFQAASFTKPGDLALKGANLPLFNDKGPWLKGTQSLLRNIAPALKTGAFVASRGFGVLGIGSGVLGIIEGAQTGDGWKLADGIVGTVTSLGSLVPPPIGVAFAAVGAAYTAGRWLFGEDENGDTGIDHIVNTGKNIANVANDVNKAVADKATEVIDNLWPW